jgi:hypothetical protein
MALSAHGAAQEDNPSPDSDVTGGYATKLSLQVVVPATDLQKR